MIQEDDIMELLRQGNLEAGFELLMERLKKPTFHLSLAFLADASAAEDAAQDAFVRVWRGLPTFRGTSSLSTWVYSITRNVCLTELKRRRNRGTVSLETPGVEPLLEAQAAVDSAQSPFGDSEEVLFHLARLPARHQTILRLHHLEQRSYHEIATLLGIPMGTVKTHLHRARMELHKRLLRARSLAADTPAQPATP